MVGHKNSFFYKTFWQYLKTLWDIFSDACNPPQQLYVLPRCKFSGLINHRSEISLEYCRHQNVNIEAPTLLYLR